MHKQLLGMAIPSSVCGSWAGVRRLPTDGNLRAGYFQGLFYPPHFKTAGAQTVEQYA